MDSDFFFLIREVGCSFSVSLREGVSATAYFLELGEDINTYQSAALCV